MAATAATPKEEARSFPIRPLAAIITAVILIVILYGYLTNPRVTTAVLSSTLRQSTPLILGALCGIMCERSGVVNIGIEGQMLFAAFIAYMANVYIGLALPDANITIILFIAAIVGIAAGLVIGLFHAFMSISLKMDQIIAGTIINILALGLTSFFYQVGLSTRGKMQPIALGFLADIPLIGPILFNNGAISYATIIVIFLVHYVLFFTRWGLRTRAVGEHPSAADTVGISVNWMRYVNVTLGGALAGLAGAYLTLEAVGSFERAMTNGRGFVALAVMLFGKRTPFGSWGAALLFGFATALQTQLQFSGTIDIPHQFIGMLPYLLTILVLAGFIGRTRDPKALGQPYEKE